METLTYASSFRDLLAYRLSRELAQAVFTKSQQFPKEETVALTDQVRRSSRSVGANIAEAWAKRRYEKHFISKLTDADGEQQETQHWLETALDCNYLTPEETKQLLYQCQRVGQLIGGMIAKSSQFCTPKTVRETLPEYFLNSAQPASTNE